MKPFIYEVFDIDPLQAFAAVRHMPFSLLLDSADMNHPNNRYSFVMCHPIETIEAKNGKVTVTNWEQRLSMSGDPFHLLESRMRSWIDKCDRHANMPPFQGGAAGLFGYDLARNIEKLPSHARDSAHVPDMAVGIYDQVFAYDHLLRKSWIFTHARNEHEADRKSSYLIDLLRRPVDIPAFTPVPMNWVSNFTESEYKEEVQRVIDYITAGDIFQANLSQRFDTNLPKDFDSYAHYAHMRQVNPAPFSCYMNAGSIKISSASPERFLTVRDRRVETSPIKGTRPHVANPMKDREYRNALRNSAKDKAENTMIVDLLRNDLSRVCDAHSIEVSELCKLETFASVHHLVSTIRGKLRRDKTSLDLLRACFPGGSITGAPKIRAMEIIEEIEPSRRGAYCGSIGYIGFDGTMDSNILIRTLVYDQAGVSLQVGGGIVSDSNPDAEYQETLDKANAILRSFEAPRGLFSRAG